MTYSHRLQQQSTKILFVWWVVVWMCVYEYDEQLVIFGDLNLWKAATCAKVSVILKILYYTIRIFCLNLTLIELWSFQSPQVELEDQQLSFSAVGHGAQGEKKYGFTLHLLRPIDTEVNARRQTLPQ